MGIADPEVPRRRPRRSSLSPSRKLTHQTSPQRPDEKLNALEGARPDRLVAPCEVAFRVGRARRPDVRVAVLPAARRASEPVARPGAEAAPGTATSTSRSGTWKRRLDREASKKLPSSDSGLSRTNEQTVKSPVDTGDPNDGPYRDRTGDLLRARSCERPGGCRSLRAVSRLRLRYLLAVRQAGGLLAAVRAPIGLPLTQEVRLADAAWPSLVTKSKSPGLNTSSSPSSRA